jgi:hypothetical protein
MYKLILTTTNHQDPIIAYHQDPEVLQGLVALWYAGLYTHITHSQGNDVSLNEFERVLCDSKPEVGRENGYDLTAPFDAGVSVLITEV